MPEEKDDQTGVIVPPNGNGSDTTVSFNAWPFAAGGVVITAVIIAIVVASKKKQRFACEDSLETDTSVDNGGNEE